MTSGHVCPGKMGKEGAIKVMTAKDAGLSTAIIPSMDPPEPTSAQALRQRAEALANEKARTAPDAPETVSPEDAARALHELKVHQIELEMQNEELRRAQEELEVSRARYFDLFDLAPVAYFTLSEQGLVLEANLTAAKLLGVERGDLVQQPLSRYILREDQDTYYLHRRALWETGAPQSWEMRVLKKNDAPFWVRMESTMAQDARGVSACRAVLSDITESKRAERTLKTTNAELEEFAFALTHDLQEPLRMVVNFSQLLALEQRGRLGNEADQYISYSVEGALRIEALLKGLLNYLELPEPQRDRLPLVDCNHVLSEALLTLQMAIQQSGAIVTSDPLPVLPARRTC